MPEGPEIRLIADRLDSVLRGKIVRQVWFAFKRLKRHQSLLGERMVDNVGCRGKAMLITFCNGTVIYSHNQLYGRWFVVPKGTLPDTSRQLRLALHTSTHSALLYSASEINVVTTKTLSRIPLLARIGPDPLEPDTVEQDILKHVCSGKFSNRRVADLLLDQGFVAGIGNYLRSEILFVSCCHPLEILGRLDDKQMRMLSRNIYRITQRSYRTRGVTNSPSIVRELKKQGGEYQAYRHFVFNRDGQPCYECGTKILKTSVGSRRCYYCPNCQATL